MSRSSPAGVERRRVRRPVLVAVGLAWTVLVIAAIDTTGSGASSAHGGHQHGPGPEPGSSVHPLLLVVMVVAMMGPLLIEPLRQVTQRTVPRRRRRRAAALVLGYLGPWVVVSLVLAVGVDLAARSSVGRGGTLALALVAALAWQCTPAKQRCLNRTHGRAALVAGSHRGDVATARAAAVHAGWCVGSCGPIMLVASAAGHGLVVMATATLWIAAEHAEPARRPAWRPVLPGRLARVATRWLHTAGATVLGPPPAAAVPVAPATDG